jgi:hypothetical protein
MEEINAYIYGEKIVTMIEHQKNVGLDIKTINECKKDMESQIKLLMK